MRKQITKMEQIIKMAKMLELGIIRSKYSKTFVHSLGRNVKKPFKLYIKMQQEKVKKHAN